MIKVPERKRPDPSDSLGVLLFDAEEAYRKVALFPEENRERAWGDFIDLRGWTVKLISALQFMRGERERSRKKVEQRIEELLGCTEGSAEEVELRVLSDLLEPISG